DLAPHHARDLGVLEQVADLDGELVREDDVVRVDERDELALRDLDPRVSRRRRAAVLLPEIADLGKGLRDLAAAVGRAVVDDDHLERLVLKGEDALERLAQERLRVVDRDDDADERTGHRPATRSAIASGIRSTAEPSSSEKHGTLRTRAAISARAFGCGG